MDPRAIAVRSATLTDLDRLTTLLVAQMRDHDLPTTAATITAALAGMLGDPHAGFVLAATVDGAVEGVAYCSFARPIEHAGEVTWLEELYVAPAHRSRGLGRVLVEEVLARAEARGCVSVDLEVQDTHARVEALYARAGFRSMKRTHWTRPLTRWDW